MATGNHYQWPGPKYVNDMDAYHVIDKYSREYAQWIEQQYLKLLNKTNK